MLERGRTRRRGRIGDEAEQRHVVAMVKGKRCSGLVARGAPLPSDVCDAWWRRKGKRGGEDREEGVGLAGLGFGR